MSIDLDHRYIALWVRANDFGFEGSLIGQVHRDLVSVFDHVVFVRMTPSGDTITQSLAPAAEAGVRFLTFLEFLEQFVAKEFTEGWFLKNGSKSPLIGPTDSFLLEAIFTTAGVTFSATWTIASSSCFNNAGGSAFAVGGVKRSATVPLPKRPPPV